MGDEVVSKIDRRKYTLLKKLGQGGQGCVYLMENTEIGKKVLKWYFPEQASESQYEVIMKSISIGSPDKEGEHTFIWPEDIVEDEHGFGYVMDFIDTKRFIEYGDMISTPHLVPDLRTRCIISHNLVSAFERLHLTGYCYRDVSEGNLLFDPKTGDVVICDNDNVGVEGFSRSQVLGTLEYMAPEIILGQEQPGTASDLYSLAILLFKFWIWHHPYHGQLEYSIKSLDLEAKRWLYGNSPVFIFDPENETNRLPKIQEYNSIQLMWEILHERLQSAFIQSFTVGIKDKRRRLREYEWINIFQALLDSIIYCPDDGAENFYNPTKKVKCWFCKGDLKPPSILRLVGLAGAREIVLTSHTKLYGSHLDALGEKYRPLDIISHMSQNPTNPQAWGLYNNTDQPWKYVYPDGNEIEVPIGKNAPVLDMASIKFTADITGEILSERMEQIGT